MTISWFTDEEAEDKFKDLWRKVIRDKTQHTGIKYDYDGIIASFPTIREKREFLAYLMQIYDSDDFVQKSYDNVLVKHIIDNPGTPSVVMDSRKVNAELKYIKDNLTDAEINYLIVTFDRKYYEHALATNQTFRDWFMRKLEAMNNE